MSNLKRVINIIFNLIKKYREIITYGIFGVLTTLVNIFVYFIFAKVFNLHYLICTIIAWVIAVLFAYFTNRKFVFGSKNNNIINELISFIGFRVLSGGVEIILMYALVDIFVFNDLVSKVITNIIIIILNYVFSKLFIFKK